MPTSGSRGRPRRRRAQGLLVPPHGRELENRSRVDARVVGGAFA